MQLEAVASWPFLLWQEEMGMAGNGGDGRERWRWQEEKVMAGRGGWQGDGITESSRLEKIS